MSATATAAVDDALSRLPVPAPKHRIGDLVAITGERDGYYGRVGTVVSFEEVDGKITVKMVNGPLLTVLSEHVEDAAAFWSREENVAEVMVCRGRTGV